MITTILLKGILAKEYGSEWKLDISSPREAVRAINANTGSFMRRIVELSEEGFRYRIRVGESYLEKEADLEFNRPGKTIEIEPVLQGSGEVIWAIATFIGEVLAPVAAAWEAIGNIAYIGTALQGAIASFAIAGIAKSLAPSPRGPEDQNDERAGYLFNKPNNLNRPGVPVPLAYGGPLWVGSVQISIGISKDDLPAPIQAGGNSSEGGAYYEDFYQGPFYWDYVYPDE